MPLHGKVVVIKRSGVDGAEFPLTAACVFGRKAECDIRIQLPHVSKEHCKIDLNENKEVIITNLSSVNPTLINGEVLQQSDRLKHGDLITILDRSFRFEYPPEPTPKKKRSSIGGKTETLRVLQDKQARDTTAAETVDKTSETPSYPCLKDGTNNDNIQRTPEKMAEVESTNSPFGDLYQMIKNTLDSKSPWKPSGSRPQTPATRFCTPQPVSVRKATGEVATLPKAEECTPMQVKAEESSGITAVEGDAEVESVVVATPKSVKKEQNSSDCGLAAEEKPLTEQASNPTTAVQETPKHKRRSLTSKTPTTVATSSPLSQKKHQSTPKKFTATQMIEQVSVETPTLTPTRRKSKVATPIKPAVTEVQDQTEALPTVPSTPKTNPSPRHSPRTSEKKRQAQESTSTKPAVTEMQDQAMVTEALPSTPKTNASPRHSPRTAEKKRQAQEVAEATATVNVTAAKKRKSEEHVADMTMAQMKRKRVSFGGHLSPELFDKRMPPDSPLRKGAAPRRSLCVPKLAMSLLRRASVSGIPKAKTPSPAKKSSKAKTPSPAKKSPKAKTPSPAKKSPKAKTPSPAKKSPKAKTPSPAKKSPKAKAPSPAKNSPKAKTPSPAKKSPKVKSPSPETPTVQGRFSVSRISTPSPVAEAISATEPSSTITPKLPLSRKSMKSGSRKSNTMAKNVVEVMRRRSGVSRASLKAQNSWADIVKFGHTKSQVVEAKKASVQMKKKKAVQPKHKTPAKNVQNYVSTGHADSPVSIVVGRAHKRHVQPTGAAPRLVHNIVLLKNMKMDEDLTGIAEIFNTPVGAKQRKSSVVSVPQSATKSPVSTSVVEGSVMNTPEETGEMIVSPLAVASSAKSGQYNHEAVERLFLDDDNSNFVSEEEVPSDDISEQQCPDLETKMTTTPQQKPPQPDCLTGVKRLLKTPRQKPEPIEDLRGKLLKTPKQKAEQVECLTGVKRIMRTPRQKAEPVEDIRGKLLMTPKPEKPEQSECLSGVKRMMKTPKQKAEPVVDLGGELLKTPKVPTVKEEVSVGDIGELLETPVHKEPLKELEEPVESPKRVMKTTRLSANPPVEDLEELQELTEEPLTNDCAQMATIEGHDELHPQNESDESQQEPEVEAIVPVSADDVEVVKEIPVEDENNTSLPVEDDQQSSQHTTTTTVETDASQEPEVETIVPVSGNDVEVVKEIPVEDENNTSLPVEDDQQSSQHTTTTTVETDASQEPEIETIVPVPGNDVDVVQEIPIEAENNPSLPADDDQQLGDTQSSTAIEEDLAETQETHEEAVPAEKPRRGGRKIKPETKSVVPHESTEVLDKPLTIATETPNKVLKRRGRKAKQELPEAVETEKPHEEEAIIPAEKPKRAGRKIKQDTKSVLPPESTEAQDIQLTIAAEKPKRGSRVKTATVVKEVEIMLEAEPAQDDVQEENTGDVQTAATSTAIKKSETPVVKRRGRKAKQDLPEAVETEKPHEEEAIIPAEKPKRGGRKIKQDTKSVLPPESTEAQDIQLTIAAEKPKRGSRVKTATVVKEVEIMLEAEPAQDDVQEENTGDVQTAATSTAIKKSETPVVKRRGRKAKQDLPEAVETEKPHEEEAIIPAEKPKRGGRKIKQDTKSVLPPESTEAQDIQLTIAAEKPKRGSRVKTATVVKEVEIMLEAEPAQDDVQEENTGDVQTAATSTAIKKSETPVVKRRGRKAKQDLPEAVETEKPHEEEAIIPAEPAQDVEEEKSGDAPVKARKGRKVHSAVKDDNPQATPTKRARRGETLPSLQEGEVDETAVPVTKSATRGGGRPKSETKSQDADSKTKVSAGPVRKGRKAMPPADDTVVVTSTEEVMEEVQDEPQSKKSVMWKDDLTVTHVISPAVRAVRGRKPKPADDVPSPRPSPVKRDQSESIECPASETTVLTKTGSKRKAPRNVSKVEEEDLTNKTVPSEPIKSRAKRVKATDAALVETVTPATEVSETKPRRGRPAKK